METISVAINDSAGLLCFDLYLFNIFAKSVKAERCTYVLSKLALYCLSVTIEDLNLYRRYSYEDINVLGTRFFVFLNSTLGA